MPGPHSGGPSEAPAESSEDSGGDWWGWGWGRVELGQPPTVCPSSCCLFPSSSSGRHSPSLKVLWGPLWLQGSPRPKALPRPPQGLPRVLQEQPLAHLLLDPSFVPRTLEPIPSCGACSLTRHR